MPSTPLRSPLRLTLLGATGAALLGLTVGAAAPTPVQLASVQEGLALSAPVLPETDVPHVPAAPRASRSRLVPGRPAATRKPVASKAVVRKAVVRKAVVNEAVARRPAASPAVRRPAVARRVRRHTVAAARWVRPSSAGVVSPYGPRWGGFHKGLDFGAGYGAPIRVVGDGVVIDSGYLSGESGYGQITLVQHSNGFITAYAHQSRSFVHAGDHVSAGDVIGLVGSTGHSTGPHLHFEVRTEVHGGQLNPAPWLRQHGVDV